MTHYIYHRGTGTLINVEEAEFLTDQEFIDDEDVEYESLEAYLEVNPDYATIPAGVVLSYAGIGAMLEEQAKK